MKEKELKLPPRQKLQCVLFKFFERETLSRDHDRVLGLAGVKSSHHGLVVGSKNEGVVLV